MSTSSDEESGDVAMEIEDKDPEQNTSFQPFTKAERIQQLNDIDKSITELLRSAGLAIKTLTTIQSPSQRSTEDDSQQSTTNFPASTNIYLNALHSVDIQLKRQIYGLVEAGIITRDTQTVLGKPQSQSQDSARTAVDRGWDVGWLNTRSGKVGRDMEAEIWANAKQFLESLEGGQNGGTIRAKDSTSTEDMEMAD